MFIRLGLILLVAYGAMAAPVAIGRSVVALNGPWRFHTGDDLLWADPKFDDSSWETVDLAASRDAHDSDVGLTRYAPGWTAKGHRGYSGYAWYRTNLSVTAEDGDRLALAGPAAVDDAYQLFIDGHAVGSSGDFSRTPPVVYSVQPQIFRLSPGVRAIAFRVWMGRGSLGEPDAGGIHIAPLLGEASAIEARYKLQWLETFSGYIVEVVLPVLFLALAVVAGVLMAFERAGYGWLILALILTGMIRANQAVFFWTHWESLGTFDVVRNVVLVPLILGAWAMTWLAWFRLRVAWVGTAAGALTLFYIVAQAFGRSFAITECLRLSFLLLLMFIVYQGVRMEGWFAVPAIALVSIGLFAQEVSMLHVPGIWFPFGTGVSRTQYAYAAFDVAMFAVLLRRLLGFATRRGIA